MIWKRLGWICAGILLGLPPARGGLYSLEEPLLIRIGADGFVEAQSFSATQAGPFRLRLNELMNWLDSNPLRKNPDRAKLIERYEQLQGKTALDIATRGAILLRLGKPDDALNTLAPLRRSRTPDFRILANLAHVHALRGEWPEARRAHEQAILDTDMPADLLPGVAPEQLKWLLRVEREYYARWLRIRDLREQDRVRRLSKPEAEKIFPLFGELTFQSADGSYTPGDLDPAERAKLPKDAIAIVQQLLLWEPNDAGLYWLLGELYAAEGKLREALAIFDNCASESRQYSNRVLLMEHRAALREAVSQLPPETQSLDVPLLAPPVPPVDDSQFLPSKTAAIIAGCLFVVFAITMVALKIRAALRRRGSEYE